MGLKTVLWAGFFAAACLLALRSPLWGIIGYVFHYNLAPERKWWSAPLNPLGIRYSFMFVAFTAAGIAINWNKLRFGSSILCRQEKLLLLFLGIVWLSLLFGEATVGLYTTVDHPTMKMTKIFIFLLMLTHVVTTLKDMNLLVWTLVLAAFSVGWDAYNLPQSRFVKGRLEGVGGPDFSDANHFAFYMAAVLPLIGAQFLRVRWRGKLLCLAAGIFTANAVILCRSRGAFMGLAVGAMAALLLAPIKHRKKIFAGVLVAAIGAYNLMDPQFVERMSTITSAEEERDTSAGSRVVLAKAGARMLVDHPLGVGAGNFYQTIGRYVPELSGAEAHNTYLRCATELGIQGAAVFVLLIGNAFVVLRKVRRRAANLPMPVASDLAMLSFGMTISLCVLLTSGVTSSVTYAEFLWWFLALPVCLERVLTNEERDVAVSQF